MRDGQRQPRLDGKPRRQHGDQLDHPLLALGKRRQIFLRIPTIPRAESPFDRTCLQTLRHRTGVIANQATGLFSPAVPFDHGHFEQGCGVSVVPPDTAAVGIHPAKVVHRLGTAGSDSIAIQLHRPLGIARHTFTVLVGKRQFDELPAISDFSLGRRRKARTARQANAQQNNRKNLLHARHATPLAAYSRQTFAPAASSAAGS